MAYAISGKTVVSTQIRPSARSDKLPEETDTDADAVGEEEGDDQTWSGVFGTRESRRSETSDTHTRPVRTGSYHGGTSVSGAWYDCTDGETGAATF